MDNDDLRRRLEKLVALKEHPSTLPAIREEAARAEQRLRERAGYVNQFQRPEHSPRLEDYPDFERFLRDINRETAKIWPTIRPRGPW